MEKALVDLNQSLIQLANTTNIHGKERRDLFFLALRCAYENFEFLARLPKSSWEMNYEFDRTRHAPEMHEKVRVKISPILDAVAKAFDFIDELEKMKEAREESRGSGSGDGDG